MARMALMTRQGMTARERANYRPATSTLNTLFLGGSFLEFVPFGFTKAVTVVLHIETLSMPD